MIVNGVPQPAQSPAFIEGGRTFMGVRDIETIIGGIADWDEVFRNPYPGSDVYDWTDGRPQR
jgi:hypothetical protein